MGINALRSHRAVKAAAILLATMFLGSSDEPTDELVELTFEIQACQTEDFSVTFNEEARRRFTHCDEPLVGWELSVTMGEDGLLGLIESDENGWGEIGPLHIAADAPLMILVCQKTQCFKFRGLRAGRAPTAAGRSFVFYESGRRN